MNTSFLGYENTLVSEEAVSVINFVCNCIGVNVVSVVGIIGNTINILVLFRHGFKDSTNILLFSLSISDLSLVIVLPAARIHCLVSQFDQALALSIQRTASVAILTIHRFILFSSLYHVGVISLERFVAIFFPFHVSRVFTAHRVKVIVICIYLVNFSILAPWFGAFHFRIGTDPTNNKTVPYALMTEFFAKNVKQMNLYSVVTNFMSIIINFAIVTFCCLAIVLKLFLNTVKRARLFGHITSVKALVKNAKVSKMLLTLCLIFYLMFFPTTALDLYLYFTIHVDLLVDRRYAVAQYISHLVYSINSSINFLIYVTMSRKYYNTYKQLFRLGKENKVPSNTRSELSAF